MTKTEANRILGVPGSMPLNQAEQVYQQKRRQLQLQLMPGNPLSVRKNAQAELAVLTKAWQVFLSKNQAQKYKNPAKTPKPQQANVAPEDLRDLIFAGVKFSRPLVTLVIILIPVMCFLTLIRSCENREKMPIENTNSPQVSENAETNRFE